MPSTTAAGMIMDGLDTLSQVALADICFDNYHDTGFGMGRLPSESIDDSLNTPVTSSSDVTFFVDTLDPLPITATGKYFLIFLIVCCNFGANWLIWVSVYTANNNTLLRYRSDLCTFH